MIYQFLNYRERKGLRCKDCKHFARGRVMLSRKTYGTICRKKVKHSGKLNDRVVKTYYSANLFNRICDMYEEKGGEE